LLIRIANLNKSFGTEQILLQVDFRIDAREKVALVGRNGTGKTTLLKIITGELEPDAGSVTLTRGARIGYLRQEMPVGTGRTVIEEAQSGVRFKLELGQRLQELEKVMSSGAATSDDLDEYALLHEHFLEEEGYAAETDVRVVLQRVGFTPDEFDRSVDLLSGGEKTRLVLARLLLEQPELLILDEPTNHLDLNATEWLETWIRSYHGAVLLVSHDRIFLENTAERVLELRDHRIDAYPGPFTKYLSLRAERDARIAEQSKRQQVEIDKLDEYVRRFMNSQRTAQARGRLKRMNKLIDSKLDAPTEQKGMKAGFGKVARSGDIVVKTDSLTVGFQGNAPLIQDLDWTVRIGERWGVIGENGVGKSTLLKVILGELKALSGTSKLGSNVSPGYFAQDVSDLDHEMSPLQVLVFDLDMEPQPARDLLGRFLISGDDVYRPVKTLSGGEKNKLSLAKLTQINPNLLVLDEPTNHLDMASREALAEVLRAYRGTLILISHDRWLLSQVTDHTLDLRHDGVTFFPGSYAEYIARKSTTPVGVGRNEPVKAGPVVTQRDLSKAIQRGEREVETAEAEVSRLEKELKEIEEKLADPSGVDVLALSRAHQAIQASLRAALDDWEVTVKELESLRAIRPC
jgi:ATP-binding cassette subfamily F protein 3